MSGLMKGRFRRPSAGSVIATVVLAAALGGGAWAAIPGSDGMIHGCYATTDGLLLGIPHSKGDLRAVDTGERCRSYERAVAWNQQGPAGEAGPPVAGLGANTGMAAAGRGAQCTLGQIILNASTNVAVGTPARGQLLPINTNQALFSLIGTTYGGDGRTTFALPDLRTVTPDNMTYSICDDGIFPTAR
jgi:hypothetical protein